MGLNPNFKLVASQPNNWTNTCNRINRRIGRYQPFFNITNNGESNEKISEWYKRRAQNVNGNKKEHCGPYDRGIEFTSTNFIHSVENTYNKKIYFSDPQAPGQRGTNERLNRELRRIYPVGYNFTKITQKRLQESIRDLNRRPRHVLGYQTPEHEFVRRMNEIIQKTTIATSI